MQPMKAVVDFEETGAVSVTLYDMRDRAADPDAPTNDASRIMLELWVSDEAQTKLVELLSTVLEPDTSRPSRPTVADLFKHVDFSATHEPHEAPTACENETAPKSRARRKK